MKRGGHTDFILGIALCVTSLAYLLSARKIIAFTGPGAAPLDAKAIPYMWGGILFLLGISLIVRSCIRQRKAKCAPENVSSGRLWSVIKQNRKICLTFAYLALYIGFLNLIGFWIMTALFLFFEISLLCPKEKQNRPLIILFSIIVSGAVYFAFTELFHVMLPAGILEGWI